MVGPLILVALGLLILGQNLGLVSPSIWSTLLNFWPVVLILIGVELILGRGSWVGAIVVGLVVLAIVAAGAFISFFPVSSSFRSGPFVPVETINMVEEMGQARRASYELEFGAGGLSLASLPQSSSSLVEATLERDDRATIDKSVDRQGDLARVTVRTRNPSAATVPGNTGITRMAFKVSPQTETDLRVNGGAGEVNLDLRDLKVQSLNVNAGVGGAKLTMPQAAGRTTAQINAGVGGVELTIPQGVAAQITVDTGIGGANVDEGRFAKTGKNTYRSRDYDTATNRVDLDVSAGVGGVTIR